MTAETLKPFLATSNTPNASRGQKSPVVSMTNNAGSDTDHHDYSTDGVRKSPVLAARRNALLFSFCAIVSICVLALIGAEIWNTLRTTRLQQEVHQMDSQLRGLMRLMGLENDINLEELYEVYREAEERHPIQQVADDEINDYEEYETDDKLAKFLDDFENDDYSDDDVGSGDDDEDDDEIEDNDDAKAEVDGSPMYMDKEETPIKRKTRSLSEDLHFGTIVETSDKDEIMQHLIPYQELSPNEQQDFHSERPKSRRSRVIASLRNEALDAKKPPSKKEIFAQAQRRKKEVATHRKSAHSNGARNRAIGHMRKNLVTKSSRRSHPIAVHYVGHTDHYNSNYHHHYAGNGRLQHHGGVYADWKPANWSTTLTADRFFSMSHGVVTVQEPGLYHVYAQIYYYDAADESSFWVDHNERHLLQCATTVISSRSEPKASTCYTAGLVYLHSGDRIRVHDVLHHYALLKAERSFFGLVRMSGGGGAVSGVRSGEDSA